VAVALIRKIACRKGKFGGSYDYRSSGVGMSGIAWSSVEGEKAYLKTNYQKRRVIMDKMKGRPRRKVQDYSETQAREIASQQISLMA
jgi:hypothetical protein